MKDNEKLTAMQIANMIAAKKLEIMRMVANKRSLKNKRSPGVYPK